MAIWSKYNFLLIMGHLLWSYGIRLCAVCSWSNDFAPSQLHGLWDFYDEGMDPSPPPSTPWGKVITQTIITTTLWDKQCVCRFNEATLSILPRQSKYKLKRIFFWCQKKFGRKCFKTVSERLGKGEPYLYHWYISGLNWSVNFNFCIWHHHFFLFQNYCKRKDFFPQIQFSYIKCQVCLSSLNLREIE